MISIGAKRIAQAGLLALAAVPAAAAVPVPPVPPGEARVWFMRELEPGTAMYSPKIFVDGRPIGQSSQSTMFYHDVAAGQHVFDVENCMQTQGSARALNLAPGEVVSLQVTSLQGYTAWHCYPSDAYYLSPMSAQAATWTAARMTDLGAR